MISVQMGAKNNMDQAKLNEQYPRIDEFPFDSERKLMSTVHNINQKKMMPLIVRRLLIDFCHPQYWVLAG